MVKVTRKLLAWLTSALAAAPAAAAQGFGRTPGLGLDIAGGFQNFTDAITFQDVASTPEALIFWAVVGAFYFTEKNILEQVFYAIDDAVHNALSGDNRHRLHRSHRKKYDKYPTGAKGLAFATAFVTANGVLFVVGYFGTILLALLGYGAVLLGHWNIIGAGEDEEDSSSSSSGGGSSGGSGGGSGGSQNAAATMNDYIDAGKNLIDAYDKYKDVKGGEDASKKKRIKESLKYIEPNSDLSKMLDQVNHANTANLREDVAEVKAEYKDELKEGKRDVQLIEQRVQNIRDDLQRALQEEGKAQYLDNDIFDTSNELRYYLYNELASSDSGDLLEQMEGLVQVLDRLLTGKKKLDSDLRDQLDRALKRIHTFWRLNYFLENVPISIEELYTSVDPDLQAVLNSKNITWDPDRISEQLHEFREMRSAYFNLAVMLEEVLRNEMKLSSEERERIKQMLGSEAVENPLGGGHVSIGNAMDALEKNLRVRYIETGNDPDGKAQQYLENQLEPSIAKWEEAESMVRGLDDEVGRMEDYESKIYTRIKELAERAE